LLQKVQRPSLTQVKNAIQVSYDMDKAGEVTHDFLANNMAAEAASLQDHAPNRQASRVDRHPAPGSAPASEIKGPKKISSLDFTRTSRASLMMRSRQSLRRGSASTSTPRRAKVDIPKRARLGPSKSIKKTLSKMNREIVFYEGQAKRRLKGQESIQQRQGQ
jgi:hypothetical protein